jgi:hypothetical protein
VRYGGRFRNGEEDEDGDGDGDEKDNTVQRGVTEIWEDGDREITNYTVE